MNSRACGLPRDAVMVKLWPCLSIPGKWMICFLLSMESLFAAEPKVDDANPARNLMQALIFTEEEKSWITDNPVLTIGVMQDRKPLEYVENGELKGLTAEYLKAISARTGLRFLFKAAPDTPTRLKWIKDGTVDVLSIAPSNSSRFREAGGLIFTSPYQISAAIVVRRANEPVILELADLAGKTVVVPGDGPYSQALKQASCCVKLNHGNSAAAALELVAIGDADAAVGSEIYLTPYLHRRYEGMLEIAGTIPSLTLENSMVMHESQLVLRSILQKSLRSISTKEAYLMRQAWIKSADLGPPSIAVFTRRYWLHGLLTVGTLSLLVFLVYRTQREYRRSADSEREKATFLSLMSREIRTPMNTVLASVELLEGTSLDVRQKYLVSLANDGVNTLLRLVDDSLDTSNLASGKFTFTYELTDISALVREVVGLHQLRAQEKGIDLALVLSQSIAWPMLDATRIRQLLHNLLSNAIKFTDNGRIDVDVGLTLQGEAARHGVLTIKVSDTGIGISEQAQRALFQAYAQVGGSERQRLSGTGLGLLICQELTAQMNGELILRSKLGQGTVVTLTLPVAIFSSGEGAGDREQGKSTAIGGTKFSVLLVEDTPASQFVLQSQLFRLGCEVSIASNGEIASRMFRQQRYDLVLMDCDLPDTDGYTLAREFRRYEMSYARAASPILAISASTGKEHERRCIDAGMDAVMSKPIRLATLKQALKRWCSAKGVMH